MFSINEVMNRVKQVGGAAPTASQVIVSDNLVYKFQPKYLADNEWYALNLPLLQPFVPIAYRVSGEIIALEKIVNEPVTDPQKFKTAFGAAYQAMVLEEIRHGDLTRHNVLVKDNRPYIIDWSESRLERDPRPDKRPEGDSYWIERTINEIVNGDRP